MSKYILIIIASVILYMSYTLDLKQKNKELLEQLLLINTKIYQNNQLLKNKEKILNKIKEQLAIAEKNRKKLFPPSTNDSVALGQIQGFIKNVATKIGIEVVVSNWGEPILKERYKKLPVSFTIRAYPQQLALFFDQLYSYDKFLKIDTLTIGKFRKEKLVLTFTVAGYKLERQN